MTKRLARDAILQLLGERHGDATICPSEAARLVAGEDWRAAMDPVHAAAAQLAAEGVVRLSQRGETMTEPVGAYRIGRGAAATPVRTTSSAPSLGPIPTR